MEIITLSTLSIFISACLTKAGEKFSEKVVEMTLESRKELLEKFTNLFRNEILQLGLNDLTVPEEITQRLLDKPEIIEQALKKLQDDIDSFKKLSMMLHETKNNMTITNNFPNQTNNNCKIANTVGDDTNITF